MRTLILSFLLLMALMSSGQVIVIDAGHGYCNNPAKNNNCDDRTDLEIKTNLAVALKLKKLLADSTNWEVHLTRQTDNGWMTLTQRKRLAETVKADIFLSIHCNAGGGTGTESFWCSENTTRAVQNASLAKAVDQSLLNLCGCPSRRVVDDFTYMKNKDGKFFHLTVLEQNRAIACLNEIGFVDHAVDQANLADDKMRDKYALAYFRALRNMVAGIVP